jgi:Spy/CpxP family protein refolding chaperone
MHPFYAAWQRATHRFVGQSHCHSGHEHPGQERHGKHHHWFGGRCGPGGGHEHGHGFGGDEGGGFEGGGGFGVRRPLRFLAYKLDLEERQVAELAVILDTLKTERAQAEVDQRRTTAAYADLLAAETFDAAAATVVTSERVRSAQRVQEAVQTALGKIHALLVEEQRKRLTYMLRTGTLRL